MGAPIKNIEPINPTPDNYIREVITNEEIGDDHIEDDDIDDGDGTVEEIAPPEEDTPYPITLEIDNR